MSSRTTQYIVSAKFSEDESRVLTWGNGGTIRLRGARDGTPLATFRHGDQVIGATFNADQSFLLSWSYDNTARLWKIGRREPLMTFRHDANGHGVSGAFFNKSGTRVVTWGDDGTARRWDIGINFDLPINFRILDARFRSATAIDDAGEYRVLAENERLADQREWLRERRTIHDKVRAGTQSSASADRR